MKIIFTRTALLDELFPESAGNEEALLEALRVKYTVAGVRPQVRLDGEAVIVELDVARADQAINRRYDQAWDHCVQGRFKEAIPLLKAIVRDMPWHSDAQAALGQAHYELQQFNAAMDHFIEALRWDPGNQRALIMMGNLWGQVKNEPDTALTYYREALSRQPADHIAATNAGAMLMRLGRHDEAREILERASSLDPDYPNTHLALAQLHMDQGDAANAYQEAIQALKHAPARGPVAQAALQHALDSAQQLVKDGQGRQQVERLADQLARRCGKPVEVRADASIATAARLEVAENHGRAEHLVAFKPGYPAVEHLQMHELYHLRMILDARDKGCNKRFMTTPEHRRLFKAYASEAVLRMKRQGTPEPAAEQTIDALFHGFVLQVYNAPLDLFIEYDIHREHPQLQPFQFLALGRLVDEAVAAGTNAQALEYFGERITTPNRVYTATLAVLYRELYGVDRVLDLKLNAKERGFAEAFYDEFKEYRDDREPGEEYEVLAHWAKDLDIDFLFQLVDESPSRSTDPLQRTLDAIEADPIGSYEADPDKVAQMRTFQQRAKELGVNMAVAMYMVDALKFFRGKDNATIKKAAFEIAMLGTQGIHPEKQGYRLASVPNVTFSGFHLLAYYYISFKLVLPELLKDLQLPYDKEYALAEQLYSATP